MEKLGKLPARFVKDGVVTPGNASGITDGAAAVVLTTRQARKADGIDVDRAARFRERRRRRSGDHGHRSGIFDSESIGARGHRR